MKERLDLNNKDHFDKTQYKITPGNVLVHTKLLMEHVKNESFEVQLAAMFHDVGKYSTLMIDDTGIHAHGHAEDGAILTEEIMRRLKFSNDQIKHVTFLVQNHMKAHAAKDMNRSTLRRFMSEDYFDDLIKICEADELGSNGDTSGSKFLRSKKEEFDNEVKLPDPFVTGKDLIDLGFKPGPKFKEILTCLMDLQLEGIIRSKEEGLKELKERFYDTK